ncbi:MAG: NAD-dependent epimerase/dehydratase family protein [Methanobacterium sp.]
MKSLVTGGAGFIGSHIVDKLINLGHEVIVIDNESAESNEKFHWNQNAKNYKLDICNYEKTRELYTDVDYVFHLAAEARIQPAIKNPLLAVKTNVLGTATVLQCSREAGVDKVIYSSSSSGYGHNEIPNNENQIDDCLNPYSVSKISGEKLCSMYTKLFGLKTVIFRYFNVYGERQPLKGQYAPVVGIFLRQRAEGNPLTIVGDGEQRRDFTHVSDAVNANILAATINVGDQYYGQLYNVGPGKNYSINEIANTISNNQINIEPRIGEARETLADNSKIKSVFGWEAKINLMDWITKQ